MKRIYEVIIIVIFFAAICFIFKGQQRITLNDGQGFDGVFYYEITEQIHEGVTPIVGDLPFIKRLGTPFLVSRYSKITEVNLLDSALIINLIGIFITVILLLFWLRLFIETFWIRCLLCFLFMMAWHVPLRYSFFYPMSSDAWGSVWFLSGLLLLHAIRTSFINQHPKLLIGYVITFSLIISVGSLFREFIATLCILPFFILNPLSNLNISKNTLTISHSLSFIKKTFELIFKRQNLIFFIPIISIVITSAIISNFIVITEENGYSYWRAVLRWFYNKTLPAYFLGILIACGPLILLVPFSYKKYKALLWERQELLALLFIALLFGFIGGSDTERIFFMTGFPIVLILIGISIKNIYDSTQRWWLYVLLVLQSIAFRFFWNVPNYPSEIKEMPIPFLSLIGDQFQLLYLFSYHGHFILNTILFLEYVALFIVTGYVIHNKVSFRTAFKIK